MVRRTRRRTVGAHRRTLLVSTVVSGFILPIYYPVNVAIWCCLPHNAPACSRILTQDARTYPDPVPMQGKNRWKLLSVV
jgi:hypothetical protein